MTSANDVSCAGRLLLAAVGIAIAAALPWVDREQVGLSHSVAF